MFLGELTWALQPADVGPLLPILISGFDFMLEFVARLSCIPGHTDFAAPSFRQSAAGILRFRVSREMLGLQAEPAKMVAAMKDAR